MEGWNWTTGQGEWLSDLRGKNLKKEKKKEGFRDVSKVKGEYLCLLEVMELKHHRTMSQ